MGVDVDSSAGFRFVEGLAAVFGVFPAFDPVAVGAEELVFLHQVALVHGVDDGLTEVTARELLSWLRRVCFVAPVGVFVVELEVPVVAIGAAHAHGIEVAHGLAALGAVFFAALEVDRGAVHDLVISGHRPPGIRSGAHRSGFVDLGYGCIRAAGLGMGGWHTVPATPHPILARN